VGLFRLLL
jgi:hypothetical protein